MHPLALLIWALREDASRLIAVPLMACVRKARVRKRRVKVLGRMPTYSGNSLLPDKTPDIVEEGHLWLNVPVEVVRQINGPKDDRDVILLVTIPRDMYERAISPIVSPRQVNGGVIRA